MGLNSSQQNIHKGRVLVIDADREARLCVKSILEPQGYQVVISDSWPEARNLLQQLDHFDLVLSDLQAGGGKGEDTVKTFLALGGVTVVMIAVKVAEIQEGRAALCHGAAGYLLQPFDVGELQTQVDRSLLHSEEEGSHIRLYRENSALRADREVFSVCLRFLQVDDLDRLGDLILDTLIELCVAESAILWLTGIGRSNLQLHSLRGLSQIGAAGSEILDVTAESPDLQSAEAHLSADLRTLYVPFHSNDKVIGLARLESPAGRETFSGDDCRSAASAATFAAVALSALLRRQEIEHNLLRAPGSQAYNMTFFRDHLEKELFSAKRYDRKLSLIKIVIDNYAELSARFLDRQVQGAVEKMIATIMTVLRDADLICTVLPGQFYVLLPETDPWGALMTQRRMRKALSGQLLLSDLKKNLPIRIQMRAATAPHDGATLPELDQLLETRLARLRSSLLLRSKLEDASFWKIVDALLAPDGSKLLRHQGEASATFMPLADGQFAPFRLAVCREILRAVPVRGVILWGSADLAVPMSVLSPLLAAADMRTVLYLLGDARQTETLDLPTEVTISLEDESLRDKAFLLCLGEDYAYVLLARRTGTGWHVFHTNDGYFVETLLAKLQDQYQFRAQI